MNNDMCRRWGSLAVASAIIGVLSWSAGPAVGDPADPPVQYTITSSVQDVKSWQHVEWHGQCAAGYFVNGQLDTYSFTPYVWINGADDISLSESDGEDSFVDPLTGIHWQGLYVKVWNSDLVHDHQASITWQCVPVGTTSDPDPGYATPAPDVPFTFGSS